MMTFIVFLIIATICLLFAGFSYLRERSKGDNNVPDWKPPLKTAGLWFAGLFLFYLIIVKSIGASNVVDYLWYFDKGVPERWITEKVYLFGLWLGGFFIAWITISTTMAMAWKEVQITLPQPRSKSYQQEYQTDIERARSAWGFESKFVRWGSFIGSIIIAIFFASALAAHVTDFQLLVGGSASGHLDPIWNLDVIQFYDFKLTIWQVVMSWSFWLMVVSCCASLGLTAYQSRKIDIYSEHTNHNFNEQKDPLFTRGVNTLTGYGIIAFVFWAIRVNMQKFLVLLDGTSKAVGGPGYTDVTARIPAYGWIIGAIGLGIGLLIWFYFSKKETTKSLFLPAGALVLPIVTYIVSSIVIGITQYSVTQQGMALEKPYIDHKLETTAWAWGLENVRYDDEWPFVDSLTPEELAANNEVLMQGRIMDWTELLKHNIANNEPVTFYQFDDVEMDRYNGRMYMLALREYDVKSIDSRETPWVRNHLRFTHGYGYTVADISTTVGDGQPLYVVKNIPPEGPDFLLVKQYGIYFGKDVSDYAIIKTTVPEYDYPDGNTFVETSYEGPAGVQLNTWWKRFVFAIAFDEPKILFSPLLTNESRILYNRDTDTIVNKLLPDAKCDSDEYFKVGGYEPTWIYMCFTASNHVPYSEHLNNLDSHRSDTNYLRTAYVVTIGAYSGEWHIYRMDQNDPISGSWAAIYPSLFTSAENMPVDVATHVRWPDDMMTAQRTIISIYHNIDASGYYTREQSMWALAKEADEIGVSPDPADPRFVYMRVPGEQNVEFVSTTYFTTQGKIPLIAGMIARIDPGHWGEIIVFRLPTDPPVMGFEKVDSKIQGAIGNFITLNNSEDKKVIYGDTVAIPVFGADGTMSLVYIKAIYLEVDKNIAVKYVFVINGEDESKIAYGPTLESALSQLYSTKSNVVVTDTSDATLQELIALANQHWMNAQSCAGSGDWICWGQEMKMLGEILQAMEAYKEQ